MPIPLEDGSHVTREQRDGVMCVGCNYSTAAPDVGVACHANRPENAGGVAEASEWTASGGLILHQVSNEQLVLLFRVNIT